MVHFPRARKTVIDTPLGVVAEQFQRIAEGAGVSRATPSDMTLKQMVKDLRVSNPRLPGTRLRFANITEIDVPRQGNPATTIDPQFADLMYDFVLYKQGVHVGPGTKFPDYLSANQLAKKESGNTGGRYSTAIKSLAESIFAKRDKLDSGFVEFRFPDGTEYRLSIAGPEYFIGAKGIRNPFKPDIFLGQFVKRNSEPAAPALQLSPNAQNFILDYLELSIDERSRVKALSSRAIEDENTLGMLTRLGEIRSSWIPKK